jgi:hypothetical protein
MPEREPFNELEAEHILGAEAADIPAHPSFGNGRRLATPSGRNLDVFDTALGINGRGLRLFVDRQSLTPVYTADSVRFEGTAGGLPLALEFYGDTGEVIFINKDSSPQASQSADEPATSSPPPDATDGRQAAAKPGAERNERGEPVQFTGNLDHDPRVFRRDGKVRVKLAVAQHETGKDGRERTVWHEVWPVDKLAPTIAAQADAQTLTQGTEVFVKGYEHQRPPTAPGRRAKPFVRALVITPAKKPGR